MPLLSLPHLRSGALDNASKAWEEVRRSLLTRAQLQHLLEEPSDEPGTLSALDERTCWELLSGRSTGRLAYVAREGTPDVVPVNYAVHRGTVLLRSAPGPKLQAAHRGDTVAFEVDDLDESARGGWSVVVHGRAEVLRGPLPPTLPEPWATGPRHHLVRIQPRRVSGRLLRGADA